LKICHLMSDSDGNRMTDVQILFLHFSVKQFSKDLQKGFKTIPWSAVLFGWLSLHCKNPKCFPSGIPWARAESTVRNYPSDGKSTFFPAPIGVFFNSVLHPSARLLYTVPVTYVSCTQQQLSHAAPFPSLAFFLIFSSVWLQVGICSLCSAIHRKHNTYDFWTEQVYSQCISHTNGSNKPIKIE
jgi:hypothetical protein